MVRRPHSYRTTPAVRPGLKRAWTSSVGAWHKAEDAIDALMTAETKGHITASEANRLIRRLDNLQDKLLSVFADLEE